MRLPDFLAVREQWNAALHTGFALLKDPVGDEVGMPMGFVLGSDLEKSLPWVAFRMSCREGSQAISFRNVLSDGMAFIAMHPAFALFKINGIGRQVPMHHCMAPGVEVQAFLAY